MSDKNPVIRSGSRLPSGRAVLGGLLITLAVLAVLLATRLGEDATFQDVVVARRDLAPGTVLEADDVAEVRIRLDESVDFVATSSADVVGSVLLGPLSRLEFVQTSNLASGPPSGVPAGLAEVSIPIEPQRAPERLSPGELVSVLATYDDDPTTTVLIADRVVVLSYRTRRSHARLHPGGRRRMSSARYVVLGLAPVRSEWFRSVARWANEAAIPVEFIKCISATEVRARLDEGRPFSAVLVDASVPGADRDLFDAARTNGCATVIVDNGLVERDWGTLGVAGVLAEPFTSADLLNALERVGQRVEQATDLSGRAERAEATSFGGRTVVVTGTGGIGSSTVAMAVAQGLAREPDRTRLVLADMALRSSQAMMHDARDMVPGLVELVDGHRLGTPEDDDVARTIYDLPDRGYHLLLGLRHERDWHAITARSLAASWASLDRLYTTVVADVTGEFEGTDETGANDLEDRNRLARTAARRADLASPARSWNRSPPLYTRCCPARRRHPDRWSPTRRCRSLRVRWVRGMQLRGGTNERHRTAR